MASIIKRKKAYSVVYNYIDENGETKQKWETWHTHKEALKRKAEVENQINTGTFLPPNNQKVSDFLYDFVSTYGAKQWGVSMYDSQTALIANYINPIIGDMEVQAITPRVVDKYIQTLQKTPPVCKRNRKPKTKSSERKVWLPKTVAYILREWKKAQDELKSFLGEEYQDYDLVVALPNGRPCENRIIEKEFSLLKEKAGLPNVVFHSLRHSSTTYKLKLNHGDLKATQGDTGHAEIDMITKVYAHILDEDRKINAQKFESAFYANPDLRNVKPPQEPEQPQAQTLDLAALVEQLQKSPELASTLAALLTAQKAG